MDDARTREALDALADLFLTEAATPPRAEPAVVTTSAVRPPASPAPSRPMRLAPKIRPAIPNAPRPAMTLTTQTPLRRDKSAAFGGRSQVAASPRVTQDEETAADISVQAVFLGHLPVFAAPWLTQYARHVAQQHGRVALVHLDDEQVRLDVIDATLGAGKISPPAATDRPLLSLLRELSQAGPDPVRQWIFYVPDPDSPQGIDLAGHFDHWTFICGADDVAVVHAYRTLKQLIESNAERSERRVGVMVMGSDESKARGAVEKLIAAGNSFLHTPVIMQGFQKQMAPVQVTSLGTFAGREQLWDDLTTFIEELNGITSESAAQGSSPRLALADQAPPRRTRPSFEPEFEEPDIETITSAHAVGNGDDAGIDPADEVIYDEPQLEQPVAASSARSAPPRTPPRVSPVEQPVAPAPKAEPAISIAGTDDDSPDLSQFLTAVPAGHAMEARCPRQPRTQLLLDGSGVMHLLRQHELAAGDSLRDAMVDLLEARAWVREHVSLLKLTERGRRFDEQAEPQLHLFTDDARSAAGLSARLSAVLKLHLLQRVRVRSESVWVCNDLN